MVDELQVGPLSVTVKHSCIRRDLFDIRLGRAFPRGIRELLAPRGVVRGGDALFTVDVSGVHQITVAVGTGRMVVMPKLATERADQRRAALGLARQVAALIEGSCQPRER